MQQGGRGIVQRCRALQGAQVRMQADAIGEGRQQRPAGQVPALHDRLERGQARRGLLRNDLQHAGEASFVQRLFQ